MDTSPGLPHPKPQQTAPAPAAPGSSSPSPRKRSLQDPNGDNQENNEPSTTRKDSVEMEDADQPATSPTEEPSAEPERMVRVEIPLSSIPTPNTNAEQVPPPSTPQHSSTANVPAAKKRKLSPSSKEAKQQEKEARDRQRAEEKVKKEEEKAKKEEEKAKREEEKKVKEEEKKRKEVEREEEKKKRDAEKEEKKRVKDEERAVKEEEKRKREEEKSKKERVCFFPFVFQHAKVDMLTKQAQTKLNAFFAKPKASAESSNPGPSGSPKKNASDGAATNEGSSDVVSDYKRVFPDFFLQSHTKVAPPHRFERDSEALEVMRQRVDECLKSDPQEPLVFRPSELFRMMPYKRRRGRQAASVKDILLQIQNMGSNGDGPTAAAAAATTAVANPGHRPQDQLKKVRMKSLKFGEDVRPPYQGTYTKKVPESSAYKLSRNPYRRELPDTSYDYDSEAEWEEPEEGEELDSEEEEEGSEDGDDDMEGFLDDEEDQPAVDGKRRLIVGDLEPQSTGLRWQETEAVDDELQMYQIQTISDSVTFPIDPFSTVYWQKPKPDATPASNGAPTPGGGNPTHATAEGSNGGHGNALTLLGSGTGKTKGKPFPPEQLAEFKGVVDGSDLTKMGLVEILKKK